MYLEFGNSTAQFSYGLLYGKISRVRGSIILLCSCVRGLPNLGLKQLNHESAHTVKSQIKQSFPFRFLFFFVCLFIFITATWKWVLILGTLER